MWLRKLRRLSGESGCRSGARSCNTDIFGEEAHTSKSEDPGATRQKPASCSSSSGSSFSGIGTSSVGRLTCRSRKRSKRDAGRGLTNGALKVSGSAAPGLTRCWPRRPRTSPGGGGRTMVARAAAGSALGLAVDGGGDETGEDDTTRLTDLDTGLAGDTALEGAGRATTMRGRSGDSNGPALDLGDAPLAVARGEFDDEGEDEDGEGGGFGRGDTALELGRETGGLEDFGAGGATRGGDLGKASGGDRGGGCTTARVRPLHCTDCRGGSS